MSKQTEALKLALEAIEHLSHNARKAGVEMGLAFVVAEEATDAIREALAERCVCGEPDTPGTHRTDGPCLAEQPAIKQALTPEQPAQRCKYGNEPVSCTSSPMDCQCAIDALFEQPAQQQEPEGVVIEGYEDRIIHWRNGFMPSVGTKLYTSPPANANAGKPWVGLTSEEVKHQWEIWRANIPRYVGFAKGIEAKLKEKNA